MSAITTDVVWNASQSRNGSRLVLLAMAREADDDGKVTLTQAKIAELSQLSLRAVAKCLNDLSELGEISRSKRGGGPTNPNTYAIRLNAQSESDTDGTEAGKRTHARRQQDTEFSELCSESRKSGSANLHSGHRNKEDSASYARGGVTPYGSNTNAKRQAGLSSYPNARTGGESESVNVPPGAQAVVAAMTNAGMIVGWRLNSAEWDRVTALAARWGAENLVEIIARRWDPARPPQSARYLLRIWADLPSQTKADSPKGNVVRLRQTATGWKPYCNSTVPSAYQNGF